MRYARFVFGSLLMLTSITCTYAQTNAPAKNSGPATAPMAPPVPLGGENWQDLPAAAMVGTPSVDMGGTVKVAMVQGNPMQAGQPYTVRLYCSDGTKIAPHWHPTAENVTVLKGKFALAMGSQWDPAALQDLSAGGFVTAPARMRHFGLCKGETVVQVHGLGPFVINWVPAEKAAPGK